jgi:hypothetical protein
MLNKAARLQVIYLSISVAGTALTLVTGKFLYLVLAVVIIVLHLIFRDTMNRFQWFPFWGGSKRRIYWVARDNALPTRFPVGIGHAYFNISPDEVEEEDRYFTGTGVYVRVSHWSFQVGFGRRLQSSPWHREIEVPVDEIRKGVDGVWESEEVPVTSGTDS